MFHIFFSEVFVAKKNTTGDIYAVKRLSKEQAVNKNQVGFIRAERNILAVVRNPFIVRSYFSFQTKRNLFLVCFLFESFWILSMLLKLFLQYRLWNT